jgi:integrase
MTRSNVAERLARAVSAATPRCPSLQGRVISPHTLRHTTAMHRAAGLAVISGTTIRRQMAGDPGQDARCKDGLCRCAA